MIIGSTSARTEVAKRAATAKALEACWKALIVSVPGSETQDNGRGQKWRVNLSECCGGEVSSKSPRKKSGVRN